MKNIFESLIVAMSMYSKIPMPHINWTKENMRYALCFFPVAGIAVGIVARLWWLISGYLPVNGSILTTAVYILIPIIITGGIHLDGLLDTADALSSWQPVERRLEILKDSHAGAFAIIICCSYFAAYFGIMSEMDAASINIICLGFAFSRALSGFGIATFKCAKNTGLVSTFANGADKKRVRVVLVVEACIIAVLMVVIDPVRGLLAIVSALITCLSVRKMAYSKFGGIGMWRSDYNICYWRLS